MAEQLFPMMSRVSEIDEVGSHLTRFRRHRDERTGHYVLSLDGEAYSVPLISVPASQPHVPTGVGAHQKHPYAARLVPGFPAGIQNRTENASSESGGLTETYHMLEFVPEWATTQLSQTEVTTIGREPGANLCINEATVSRHHAQIACIRQHYVVHDLGSKNGTFVNDIRLESGKVWVLNPNDRIRFGKAMVFIFQVHPSESVEHNWSPDLRSPGK